MRLYKHRSQLRAGNPDPHVRKRLGFICLANVVWVLLMVWLIVKAGFSSAKQLASSTVKKVKAMLTTRTSSGQPLQSPTLLGIQVPSP